MTGRDVYDFHRQMSQSAFVRGFIDDPLRWTIRGW